LPGSRGARAAAAGALARRGDRVRGRGVRGGGRDGAAGVGGGVRHENRRRTRRSVDVPAPAGEPLDLDRDTRDHSVVGRRVGEADGDGKQQLEVLAGLPDELGDRVVGRLALLRLSRPFEGEEPLTPGVEERDIVVEFVRRLRPPPDPAPPPGAAQLAVHGAEPAAEREGRLKGDVARAEIIPPGASGSPTVSPRSSPRGWVRKSRTAWRNPRSTSSRPCTAPASDGSP